MTPRGPKLDRDRLMADLAALSRIGALEQGGIDRPAYSQAFREAVDWLKGRMSEAGMRVREDAAGNLIGRIGPDGPALICGSHIDSVPQGGNYDGPLGVLAGLECARALKAEEGNLERAFEVVAFADEEGAYLSLLGSRAMTSRLSRDEIAAARGRDGVMLRDVLASYGLDALRILDAARPSSDFAGYIELHIEQGPVLESEGIDIGIVEALFGIRSHLLTLTGAARHAGTTPIDRRHDALRAAAEAISSAFKSMPVEKQKDVRLTYGNIKVTPGASNVVPGIVHVVQEIRAADIATIDDLVAMAQMSFEECARTHSVSVQSVVTGDDAPVAFHTTAVRNIENACRTSGASFRRMISGAGHDAQAFADICETGMIFVPSRAGISHHPDEFTHPEHIGVGLQVLYQACGQRLTKRLASQV